MAYVHCVSRGEDPKMINQYFNVHALRRVRTAGYATAGDCLMSPLVQLLTTDQVYPVSHISVQDLLNVGPTNLVTSGFCYTDVLQKTVNPRRKTKYTAHQGRDIVTTSSKHMIS